MKKEEIRVAILRIEGINCEQESLESFRRLGVKPEFVHLKQFLHIDCSEDEKRNLFDFHCLMIPGGFSAGDYVRAGAILASRIKSGLGKELVEFVSEGYPILGVCNGFQVLIELGLLPGIDNTMSETPTACLHINDSNKFECRPTLLKHENNGKCVFTKKIPKGDIRLIPSAHAEGKLIFPIKEQERYVKLLEESDQIVFRYVDPSGEYAGYPWNPNGSISNIAGICNREGNVFGLMPHPERVFYRFQHPDWIMTQEMDMEELKDKPGDGQAIFESVINYLCKKF